MSSPSARSLSFAAPPSRRASAPGTSSHAAPVPLLALALLCLAPWSTAAQDPAPWRSPADDPELRAVITHIRTRASDRIPAIDAAAFVDTGRARTFLADGDLVVGVDIDGVAKAYPIRFLNGREVVNDSIGTQPVTVCWCPIVAQSVVYDPRVSQDLLWSRLARIDTTLTFGVSGILRESALVMYDRATISLWTLAGKAIAGPLAGARLRVIPSRKSAWSAWLDRHPRTLVMGPPPPGYPRPPVGRPAPGRWR